MASLATPTGDWADDDYGTVPPSAGTASVTTTAMATAAAAAAPSAEGAEFGEGNLTSPSVATAPFAEAGDVAASEGDAASASGGFQEVCVRARMQNFFRLGVGSNAFCTS